MVKTLLAIGAHHDDIEVGAGGTIAKYIKNGWRVLYVIATTTPHYELSLEMIENNEFYSNIEAVKLREDEARKGAKILGIKENDVIFLNLKSQYWYLKDTHQRRYFNGLNQTPEEFNYLINQAPGREFITYAHNTPSALDTLAEIIGENNVSIVLTQYPDDPHLEHYAVASYVSHVVMSLVSFGMNIDLYAWSESDARHMLNSFGPTHFVDISDTIDIKCKSLEVFKSQFKDRNPQPFIDMSINRAKLYGKLADMDYAEAFMKFNTEPYDKMKIRLPITYDSTKAKKDLD